MSLLAGMLLFDRGFVRWRNDPRDFPNANGVYPTAAVIDPALYARFSDQHRTRWLLEGGLLLVLSSVLALGVAPFERPNHSERS